MSRNLSLLSAAVLAALGTVLLGEGLWIRAKAVLAQVLLERAFSQSIVSGQPVKPWSWADTWPVARISVPRLGEQAIVLASGSGQSLAFGPGHLEGTPDAGQPGTTVYAAHRDTHFAFLGELRTGDVIRVTRSDGTTYSYRVTGADVVRYDDPKIDAHAKGINLALATCWPLDGHWRGPMRYVVHASLER